MTELEKIAYAKFFIDSLANGVNPIDNSAILDNDIINNVRLSRCFFYVSDILRQIIDNGGIYPAPQKKEAKVRKQPYTLSLEQVEGFEYSNTPITATELFSRIIAIGPTEGVKKFPKRNLYKWLFSLNMVEEVVIDNNKVKRPTPIGEEIGLVFEECDGLYGKYHTILYTEAAQHFVMDNIEAILKFDNKVYKAKMNLDNQFKVWSVEENSKLVEMYEQGYTVGEIALALKRGKLGIKVRLRKNGINVDEIPANYENDGV